jgi:hypothetical protein
MTADANAGLDLFYNPTPLLRAVLTVNTDFAQTEVDQRQIIPASPWISMTLICSE